MNRIYIKCEDCGDYLGIESTTIDNEGDIIIEVSHCSCTEGED